MASHSLLTLLLLLLLFKYLLHSLLSFSSHIKNQEFHKNKNSKPTEKINIKKQNQKQEQEQEQEIDFHMSSDLFIHGDSSSSSSLFHCSSSDLVFPSDAEIQLFSDHFSPNFADSFDFTQPIIPHNSNFDSVDHSIPMHNLSLQSSNVFQNFPNFDIKNEESHLGFTSNQHPLCFIDPSENAEKSLLQRSFSEKPGSFLESLLMDSPNFPNNSLPCSDSHFFSSQIRRVFSTGDLQVRLFIHCFSNFLLCFSNLLTLFFLFLV